jgi:PAS domain S-box-containing protein
MQHPVLFALPRKRTIQSFRWKENLSRRDLSDAIEAEVVMKETMDSERDGSESIGVGRIVFTIDLKGQFTYVNSTAQRVLGYETDELFQMNLTEIVAPEQRQYVEQQITRSVDEPFGAVYEIEIVSKDGRRIPVEMSTQVVTRDARAIELQGIALLVTGHAKSRQSHRVRCLDERFTMAFMFEPASAL